MTRSGGRPLLLLCAGLALGCGASERDTPAGIQLRLAAPAPSASGLNQLLAFAGGGAVRPGLHSLAYHIYSVQICESLEVSGSGFNQASGCYAGAEPSSDAG